MEKVSEQLEQLSAALRFLPIADATMLLVSRDNSEEETLVLVAVVDIKDTVFWSPKVVNEVGVALIVVSCVVVVVVLTVVVVVVVTVAAMTLGMVLVEAVSIVVVE
jgi:hypothetical protein